MCSKQWHEYKRLVAEGVEPSEAYGRLGATMNDRRWLRWLEHCREKVDVEAEGCIMAVRKAPFEFVAAQEDPAPDPFDWGPEGKIQSSCVVSGSAPGWVYVTDPEDACRSLEDWD